MIFGPAISYTFADNKTKQHENHHRILLLFNISLFLHKKPNLLSRYYKKTVQKVALQTLLYLMLQAILFSNIQQMKTDYTKYNLLLLLFLLRLSCCLKRYSQNLRINY
jgi:hypothetical protein